MIADNEIRSKVSPFSMRQNEIKVFDGKDGYVSMNQIMAKINSGVINDVHFQIIELINEFDFLTSRQLFQLLQIKGIEIKDQNAVNRKLDQLMKNKIITRYYFKNESGMSDYRVYCLEKMGKYILTSREIPSTWQPSDVAKPIEIIKKKLSINQLLIAYMTKVKAFKTYKNKPELSAKIIGKKFKAGLRITVEFEGKNIDFIYESIRREDNWHKKLEERLVYYRDFYNNFASGDSGFAVKPQLVLLCEDSKHMAETFKEIVMNKLEIPNINIYYTTDLLQNEESMQKTLSAFTEQDGKYKLIKLDAKLLA